MRFRGLSSIKGKISANGILKLQTTSAFLVLYALLKMKELQNTFILAICLLAFTTVVFFFKYGKERAQSKALEAENIASQTLVYDMKKRAEQRAEEAERLSKIAKQSAEANMLKVKQAREMLEKSKRQSELTQKELVKNLNAQLEREADARIAAENASKELQKQRDILRLAVADAKSALDELKKKLDIARKQDLLAQREAEIERLKKRQSELERLRIEAEESQRKTEEQLLSRGVVPTLPRSKLLLLSPNVPASK